jgi:hypothetical protein
MLTWSAASGTIPIPYDAPNVAPPHWTGFANRQNDKGKLREPHRIAARQHTEAEQESLTE